jgi:hypothetical protein
MVPKILDGLPPVTRLRMFEVARAVSLKKFAVLPVPTVNWPKL